MNKLAALLPLALFGCVELDESDEPVDTAPAFSGPLGGRENNGPYLLGKRPDALGVTGNRHFRVTDTATRFGVPVSVTVDENRLASGPYLGDDPWFNGVVFLEAGPGTGRLRVDSSVPGPTGWQTHYALSYRSSVFAPWVPYCAPGELAVPIAGAYAGDDVRQPDNGAVTFSCSDGAVFHCTVASFKPGTDYTDLFWQKHQSCVQMMEADYCANGIAHTFAGTPIFVRDLSGGGAPPLVAEDIVFTPTHPAPPPPAGPWFEAAWLDQWVDAGGALRAKKPECLSKLRWNTLPPHADCGLPDPRFDADARFCDEYGFVEMSTIRGARVYNKSNGQDAGLYEWTDGTGFMSTVDGWWSTIDPVIEPAPGYRDAMRIGVLMRGVPPGFAPSDLHPVQLFASPRSFALADVAPSGFSPYGGFQGLVFNLPQPGTVPLIRWKNTGDPLLSRTLPAPGPGAGWTVDVTIGHVYP